MQRFFERFDILLTPTMPCVAWGLEQNLPPGHSDVGYLARPFNHTGQPAASIPCGMTSDHLPVGLQVVTRIGGDATLVSILRVIERALGSRLTTPIEIAKR